MLFIRDRCYQVKESWGLLAEDSAGLREGTGPRSVCGENLESVTLTQLRKVTHSNSKLVKMLPLRT